MSASNALVQARIQNAWQEDYVRDLNAVKAWANNLDVPYDGKPTYGQLKAILMLAGVPNAHRIETDMRGMDFTDPALTALSGVVPQADHFPYFTSTTDADLAPLTALGRQLLAAADTDALAAVIGYLPTTVVVPDVGSLPATARAGDSAKVLADENGAVAYFEWIAGEGWQRTGDQRVKVTDIASVTDLATIPTPKAGDLARSATEVWQHDGQDWRQVTQRLTMRHIVAGGANTSVEAAWNAMAPDVDVLDVVLFDYEGVVYLYDGPQGVTLNAATNDHFVPLSPRRLKLHTVATEADRDALTDVLIGDTVEVTNSAVPHVEPLTYLYTGNAYVPINDGVGRYEVTTFNQLNLIADRKLGDVGVVQGPPREVYTYDGQDWHLWAEHKVEWRVVDAAGLLPTVQGDFNNQHVAVGDHDHVIFTYDNRHYLYVGPTGDPVLNAREEHFIPFGEPAGLTLLPKYELITAAADGQTVFTLAQPVTNPANIELNFRAVPRKNGPDYTVAGDQITFTMPSINVYAGDRLEVWYE